MQEVARGCRRVMRYFHVWFVTKYRKAVLEGELEEFAKKILAECIKRHNNKVLELETGKDHVHMLIVASDRREISGIVRTLKAVSAKEIHGTPRFRVGNARYYRRKPVEKRKSFWARRYGCREIGEKEIEPICEYIRDHKVRK